MSLLHQIGKYVPPFVRRSRRGFWIDALLVAGAVGLLLGLLQIGGRWAGRLHPAVEIDLSPLALPGYALLSLGRGLIAYALSLAFTLTYGYWAAKDRLAERILIPLLDILQSIPVLAFMPGLVLALVDLLPARNAGLELAAVVMIFTGQAWNMTFSFHNSLRSIPLEQREVATLYRFSWWQRFRWVELPFATVGLVWNSMMSMAGGWFFLMISEAFVLKDRDFRLPGIGAYMSVAVAKGNIPAMLWAILAMVLMIVLLDQLLWRPMVVWAQKFRTEEGAAGQTDTSRILDWLRRSRLLRFARWKMRGRGREARRMPGPRRGLDGRPATGARVGAIGASAARNGSAPAARRGSRPARVLSIAIFVLLLLALLFLAWKMVDLVRRVPPAEWLRIVEFGLLTLGRVLAAIAMGTLWALPAGLAIGLSPRLTRRLQPLVQVVASFPAPMLFPAAVALLMLAGVSLDWGSILLMLLGTQWYILFNVIAGAMAIPSDLREAAVEYRLTRMQRFWEVYVPGLLPYLVTGWVTAAGGAWNASIVAEFVTFRGETLSARGLGAAINRAAERGDFPLLAASVLVMSAMVVLFNRAVWKRLYTLAETRFSLSK